MIALGIGLGWLGYALAWRGYSMVKGWDLSLADIVSPTSYYGHGKQSVQWPPPLAPNTVIFPTGSGGQNASTGSSGGGKTSTSGSGGGGNTPVPASGKCPPGTIRIGNKCIQHIPVP